MANPRATTATSPSRHNAQPAWYAAVVVGMAVFLGGLLVSHPPISGYQAEAVVLPARAEMATDADTDVSASEPAIDLALADAWLKSDETLLKVSTLGTPAGVPESANGPSAGDLIELRENLRLERSGHDGKCRLLVRFVGRHRATAKSVADRAASELAGYLDRVSDDRPTETEIASLRREISLLDDHQTKLEDELNQRRYEQLAATLIEQRTELARQSSAASQATERQAPQVQRRAQLTQKIDELRIEYRTLVATRLADHPSVAAVAGQIEQLEAQLRELPGPAAPKASSINDGGPQLHIPAANRAVGVTEAKFTSIRSADREDDDSADGSELDGVRQQLRDVVLERKDAEIRLETALRLASSVWQKQWTVARCGSTLRIGGSPKNSDLLLATFAGLVAAAAVGFDWSLLWGKRILVSATQARNTLGAPLLGEISLLATEPTLVRKASPSSLKRRIVRIAEWMLIVSLFLLIMAAVSRRELAGQLARDPFGAMAEAFDTVRNAGW